MTTAAASPLMWQPYPVMEHLILKGQPCHEANIFLHFQQERKLGSIMLGNVPKAQVTQLDFCGHLQRRAWPCFQARPCLPWAYDTCCYQQSLCLG